MVHQIGDSVYKLLFTHPAYVKAASAGPVVAAAATSPLLGNLALIATVIFGAIAFGGAILKFDRYMRDRAVKEHEREARDDRLEKLLGITDDTNRKITLNGGNTNTLGDASVRIEQNLKEVALAATEAAKIAQEAKSLSEDHWQKTLGSIREVSDHVEETKQLAATAAKSAAIAAESARLAKELADEHWNTNRQAIEDLAIHLNEIETQGSKVKTSS